MLIHHTSYKLGELPYYIMENETDLETLCEGNNNGFWKKIGKVGVGHNRLKKIPSQVRLPDESVTSDRETVLRVWKESYSTLLNGGMTDDVDDIPDGATPGIGVADLNKPITYEEVREAIKSANSGNAAGCDDIPSEVFKNDICVSYLCNLFNMCFQKGKIPQEWSKAQVLVIGQ